MTLYSLALFLHILGALGLFVAMGIEWVLVAQLQRVESAERARDWLSLMPVIRVLGPVALAAILLPGIYMMVMQWGGAGWIIAAFVSLLLLPPLGMINGLRLPNIARDLGNERGPLSAVLRQRLHDPLFVASIQIRTAIALGIVFVMTIKPDAVGSVLAIGVAILAGLVVSVPVLNRARTGALGPVGHR